jgi:MYXO-CTERM domain-containing protein
MLDPERAGPPQRSGPDPLVAGEPPRSPGKRHDGGRATMRRLVWTAVVVVAGLGAGDAHAQPIVAEDDPQGIYGGTPVDACGWPSALFIGGCTGSLVHPRMVVLAAHCVAFSPPMEVRFGENFNSPARTVEVEGCVAHPQWGQSMPGDGQHDIAICELAEAVEDVPIVPILMGCEAEMLQPGAAATLVGYGQADDDLGPGPKREVATEIQMVGTDVIWVGDDVHAGCFGDSGGPAYLMLPDGSWRVFGATSGASMMNPECPQTGVWTMLHPHVPWIEQTSGIDVTPCHDEDGTWNPDETCTAFPLTPGLGGGDWATGCMGGEASGLGESCGPGFVGGTDTGESTGSVDESSSSGDLPDDESTSDDGSVVGTSEDESGGSTTLALDDTSGTATTLPADEDRDSAGCGCTSGAPADRGVWSVLALLSLWVAPRRKQ